MSTRNAKGQFARKKAAKKAVKKPVRIRKQGTMWSIRSKDVEGDFRKFVSGMLISLREQVALIQTDIAVLKSGNGPLQEIEKHKEDHGTDVDTTPKEAPKPTTIKGWLETLPEPYRTQALEVMDPKSATDRCSSLPDAISMMTVWGNTPQKYDYWHEVYCWACDPDNHSLPEPWKATEEKPWEPKVGDWVVSEEHSTDILKKMHPYKIVSIGGQWIGLAIPGNDGLEYALSSFRPATPEEIAEAERAEKLKKLVRGCRVELPDGKQGILLGKDEDLLFPWVVSIDGLPASVHVRYNIDQLTPLS